MGLFSRSKKVTPKKFGKILSDILKDVLSEQFSKDRLLKTQKRFLENGWEFNYSKYSFEVMRMYIQLIQIRLVKNYSKNAEPIINKFFDSLPKEYVDLASPDFISNLFELLQSDSPVLTVSRIAAQSYFDNEPSAEAIMYFGALSKSFDRILISCENEVKVK